MVLDLPQMSLSSAPVAAATICILDMPFISRNIQNLSNNAISKLIPNLSRFYDSRDWGSLWVLELRH